MCERGRPGTEAKTRLHIACAKHKMAIKTSGNAGRAFQFRYLTVSASIFVAKDQSRLVLESFGV